MKASPMLLLVILTSFGISGCGGGSTPAHAAELPDGQPVKLRFEVVIDGIELAVPVIGISGPGTETEVIVTPDSDDRTPDKSAGKTSATSVVLERGYTATDDLWEWRKEVEDGTTRRKDITINILSQAGDGASNQPVARYYLENAWPSKWTVSPLRASSLMLTESITFVCESVQRLSP